MKKEIQIFDYAKEIMQALEKGVLLTTKADGRVNSMTISWGSLGIEWGKPVFITYLREHRFTKEQIEKNPEFTVNIPYGEFNKKILGIAGTKSGHDGNKMDLLDVTLVDADEVSVPAIKELPLTLECRVVYRQEQDKHAIPDAYNKEFYPQDVDGSFHGANKDYHTAFYGEIVKAYIIED